MGVWIETDSLYVKDTAVKSHPAWVCGLKPAIDALNAKKKGHTLRGCVD